MTLSSFKSPVKRFMGLPAFNFVTDGDIINAEEVAIWAVGLIKAVYWLPTFNPAKDRPEYAPEEGKSAVNESKYACCAPVVWPDVIPTNTLLAWLSVGLPSKPNLKSKVGPKVTAAVGGGVDAGAEVAEEEASKFLISCWAEVVVLAGLRLPSILRLISSLARLLIVCCCETR